MNFIYVEKPKQPVPAKILIKDLKNSTVYNETVKEIENKKKAKAAKMEDGELSDSSDNRTPTLSPSPPRDDSFRSSSFSPSRNRRKSRICSPTRGSISSRADLRLVLREKEKKKFENPYKSYSFVEKSKIYNENDHKDDFKDTKDRDNKRSRSCHSQDEKRSESRTNSYRSRSGGREKRKGRSRERYDRDRSNEKRDSGRSRERYRHRSRSEDRFKYTRGRSRSRERKLVSRVKFFKNVKLYCI